MNLQKAIEDWKASRKRKKLIRSAQLKVAREGNARSVTSDEWNALAYKPLQEAMRSVRENCPFYKDHK